MNAHAQDSLATTAIAAFSSIYITGLSRPTTEAQLAELCSQYGPVTAMRIERDPQTGGQWPFGYVQFSTPDAARRAASALHGMNFRGDVLAARQLEWMPAPS